MSCFHYNKDDDRRKYDNLKEEVKQILILVVDKPLREKLVLIDTIQQLGVAYHFEREINEILKQIYETQLDLDIINDSDDLYNISLLFQLLKQQGYKVLSGMFSIFNKFKNKDGNFKESLCSNVIDILELYEASYLQVHGEAILEEAYTSHNKTLLNFAKSDFNYLQSLYKKELNEIS
ncbi:(-)-germacrene D synthase-like, partial [Carica papaya]|uniref:(-)-germacrene D synthase-like n=1 Tax=Carica papaya TaxID=3649 RepID=UPI000B8C70BB